MVDGRIDLNKDTKFIAMLVSIKEQLLVDSRKDEDPL